MNAPSVKRFTFLLSFRNGETRTVVHTDTDAASARVLVWQLLPGRDQERNPTITLLTSTGAAS
ncbi:hypothetical protein J7E70_01995 [Variovorax paradoxus]|nr:hypothetical protein [Variovorax paradoxus]MBT2299226.1 hypothetical protein [Variovorax paradoxus]